MKNILLVTLILLFSSHQAMADRPTQTYGDWTVGVAKDGSPYMNTVNSAGDILIKSCDLKSSTCKWEMGTSFSCNQGISYPGLFNSPSGANTHVIYCNGTYTSSSKLKYKFGFSNPDSIDNMMNGPSGVLGIAIPLESGQFNVSRFSLNGARQALAFLVELAQSLSGEKSQQPTGNQLL